MRSVRKKAETLFLRSLVVFGDVTAVSPGGRKFAEFVPNHVFTHENGNEFVAVVNGDVQSNKFW